jgi:uncharacterized protein YukE
VRVYGFFSPQKTAGAGSAFHQPSIFWGGTTSGAFVSETNALQQAAVSYAESFQHIPAGTYADEDMPPTTEQAVIMLASHFL